VILRYAPGLRGAAKALDIGGVDAKTSKSVAQFRSPRIARPEGAPTARRPVQQLPGPAQNPPRMTHHQSAEPWRIKLERKCFGGDIRITLEETLQQQDDRIAAGDEGVIGDAEVKRLSAIDGEKAERRDAPSASE